jgi:hypothetical protein
MATQKISKNLPKRAGNSHLKDARARSYRNGEARKVARVEAQKQRAAANAAAGKTPKRRVRPRKDNMRMCLRCQLRVIVAGSVCVCTSIGADIESRRNS